MNEMRKLMEAIERINEEDEEYSRCTWCRGQGHGWNPYATYEGGAWEDCEACNGTGNALNYKPDVDEANGILPDRSDPGIENVDEPSDGDTAEWDYWAGGISPG